MCVGISQYNDIICRKQGKIIIRFINHVLSQLTPNTTLNLSMFFASVYFLIDPSHRTRQLKIAFVLKLLLENVPNNHYPFLTYCCTNSCRLGLNTATECQVVVSSALSDSDAEELGVNAWDESRERESRMERGKKEEKVLRYTMTA